MIKVYKEDKIAVSSNHNITSKDIFTIEDTIRLSDYDNEKYRSLFVNDSLGSIANALENYTRPVVTNDKCEPKIISVEKRKDDGNVHGVQATLSRVNITRKSDSLDVVLTFIPLHDIISEKILVW